MPTKTWVGKHGSPIAVPDLDALAEKYRESYLGAKPWPHLILEDLIDPAAVAAAEAQELHRALSLEVHKGNRMVKAESPEVTGHAAQDILDSLLTPEFLKFPREADRHRKSDSR